MHCRIPLRGKAPVCTKDILVSDILPFKTIYSSLADLYPIKCVEFSRFYSEKIALAKNKIVIDVLFPFLI